MSNMSQISVSQTRKTKIWHNLPLSRRFGRYSLYNAFCTFKCNLKNISSPYCCCVMKLALHLPSFLWAIPLSWYGGKFQTNVLSETFIVIQKYCITKRSYFKVKIRYYECNVHTKDSWKYYKLSSFHFLS